MTPALATALTSLASVLILLSVVATFYLFNRMSRSTASKDNTVVVKSEPVEKDNLYTKLAADAEAAGAERAASIAAKAQIEVAKINAAAAADNLAAEQTRLERVRLLQGPPA